MKNFKSILVMVTISMGLMSCSSEEIFTPEDTTAETSKLLEKFTVKKNIDGTYYLDYTLGDKATASLSKDKRSDSNDFYLYSSDYQGEKNFKENVSLSNDALKIGFVDTESGRKTSITVLDENIRFNRDDENEYLNNYSVTSNENGDYDLDFKVKNNVMVDFVYNQIENIYEIHLEEGTNAQRDYFRTFVKEEGVDLKIDFVNHFVSTTSREEESTTQKKPRFIIESIIEE